MKQKRARRVFTAAFKMEAVRRMEEQQALKIPVTEIAREFKVTPDMLRSWKRQLRARAGQAPADVFPGEGKLPSAEDEVRQLRRELEVARQETAFLKKAAVSSTGQRNIIRCSDTGEWKNGTNRTARTIGSSEGGSLGAMEGGRVAQ